MSETVARTRAEERVEAPAPKELTGADVTRIMELLPHRYPMLMIDRIKSIIPNKAATGIKNVTINEPFFQGHFPGHPIMPGVMIIEAMAQTAAALVMHSLGEDAEDRVVYFMTIDRARFRHPVGPGDQLEIPVEAVRNRGPVWKFRGVARIGDVLAAEAEFSATMVDN